MSARTALPAFALAFALLVCAPVAVVATNPDFEGPWRSTQAGDAWDPTKPPGVAQQAPLTPEYQATYEASLRDQAAGGRGNNYRSSCVLDGMPRLMSLTAPMEILVQPRLTFFVFEEAFARRIHTDGTPMPVAEPPAFQGYAIGRWIDEGGDGRHDVLEIETKNFKGPRAMDSTGLPLARDNQTMVKERLYLEPGNKDLLYDDITTADHAFTRPWTVTKTYRRDPNPRWAEYNCQPPAGSVFIGPEEYRLSPDSKLAPSFPGQPPPDLRYFKPVQK
jgi:hypothetical protein